MKLILSQYLKTLKERDEFDILLPDLLLTMGYVALAKPQAGTREYGVDLAVVGRNPDDNVEELLLFVIKQNDLGRADWDSGPTSVRQSLNDVIDIYLKINLDPSHVSMRKKIILTTTGNLKRDVQISWNCYVEDNQSKIDYEFWGADKVALLMEEYMLDEHIFNNEDRVLLRKSLALAADGDYDQSHLHRLYLKQLNLNDEGNLIDDKQKPKSLLKGLRMVSLFSHIFAQWAEDEGNLKQSLIASERALLWSWHRINLESNRKRKKYYEDFFIFLSGYASISHRYFSKLQNNFYVRDGLAGWGNESSGLAITVFEQIGLISLIGLSQLFITKDTTKAIEESSLNASIIADGLINMIENNSISGSPVLDEQVIDITLALMLLVSINKIDYAKRWVLELIRRVDFTFKSQQNFPICTDSLHDLVDLQVFGDQETIDKLNKTSWLLPTLAGWAALLKCEDSYKALSNNSKKEYPEVSLQLWHPIEGLNEILYFKTSYFKNGETEAPILLPNNSDDYVTQMTDLLNLSRYDVLTTSNAYKSGVYILDLMACRHFRTPVPPFVWYQFANMDSG